jgi:hypothetical protein
VTEDPTYYAPFCEQIALYGDGPAAGGQGGIPGLQCPVVNVSEQPQECGEQTSGHTPTIVTFTSTDPSVVPQGMGTCTELNPPFPAKYKCNNPPVTASIQADCTYDDPGIAHCADHYNLDTGTGMCVWDGSLPPGDQCPEGYNYDAANGCCSISSGSGTDYPLCPAGYSPVGPVGGPYKCLPGDDPASVGAILGVSFNQCFPGGGSCAPQSCGYKETWDAKNCCCAYLYGGCVLP